MLPSFPSIRERNLRTLYGDGGGVTDKSPKGSVDVKIRPLVDLINRHPEYVTLSSCSGRVALFDPTAGSTDSCTTDDDAIPYQLLDDHPAHDIDEGRSDSINNDTAPTSTNSSGKGHGGKWIFVTHDTSPDLGAQIIHSLKQVGRERLLPVAANNTANSSNTSTSTTPMLPITFKHEPPLLHIAASNIESGMRLLRIIKSAPTCAMRESGLVVTDKRVTVEIRTTSTMLTLPIMVRRGGRLFPSSASSSSNDNDQKEKEEGASDDVILAPDEEYLMSLSEMANERMIHNESLLDGLFSVIQRELFGNNDDKAVVEVMYGINEQNHLSSTERNNSNEDDTKFPMNEMARRNVNQDFERHDNDGVAGDSGVYNVTVQSTLPPLNVWKTAVVVLPRNNNCATSISSMEEIDLDVIAFGGQGVGPTIMPTQNSDAVSSIDFVDDVENNCTPQASTTCKRWNSVFRLRRQGGVWSKHWDVLPTVCDKDNSLWNLEAGTAYPIHTSSGIFGLTPSKDGVGRREGHTACVIPRFDQFRRLDKDAPPPDAVIVFGGRTSGGQGLRPTNDLFVYVTDPSYNSSFCNNDSALDNIKENNRHAHSSEGLFGRPSDVRGTPPEPRYGHTMNLLPNNTFVSNDATPFAVIAGGTGMSSSVEGTGASSFVCLNSIYTLTCIVQVEQRNDDKYPPTRSHLMWNRIADMPSPRSYHTSVIYGNHMFVFGGYAEADDPFLSSPSLLSWCTIPLNSGIESTTATENSSVTDEVPSRIGSSAVTLDLDSSTVVLLVGGARSTTITATHSHNEGCDSPLILFAPKNEHHHHEDYLASPKEFVRPRLQFLPETDDTVDFGSCVHHCLVALPQRQDDFGVVVVPDDTASAISIGGGVPCFSFGQSYARSCVINISRMKSNTVPSTSKPSVSVRHHPSSIHSSSLSSSITSVRPLPTEQRNNNSIQKQQLVNKAQVPVVYVKSCHAKAVKDELEQRGLLDKRYKMISVPNSSDDDIMIAIPIIHDAKKNNLQSVFDPLVVGVNPPSDNTTTDNNSDDKEDSCSCSLSLALQNRSSVIVRYGTELVPYSSSFLGRMNNKGC